MRIEGRAVIRVLSALLLLAWFVSEVKAQDLETNFRLCVKEDTDFDRQIRGCNWLLNSGRLAEEELLLVYLSRGIAHSNINQYESAIRDFDQVIARNPNNIDAYFIRGEAYFELGHYTRATHDLDQAINLAPNFADAYKARGTIYERLGQHDRAKCDFKRYKFLKRQ